VSSSPQVERITLGQRAADTLIGTGVSHNDVNIRAAGPSASIGTSTVAFTRYSASPVVANVASTYYAKMIYWPSIIEVNGTYHLFAAVNSVASTTNVSIGHATSTDLVNWSWAATPVLNASTSGWDSHHVDKPWVIAEPNGTGYRMFYAGWASATRMQTGVATSTDLTTWTKYSGNPVLNYSASGWDTYNSGSPNVIYESSTWKMWYSGTTVTTGGGNSMGYATSSDGYNWTKYASNPVLSRGGAGSIDRDDLQASTVRRWNGVYYMYSSCNTNGAYHVCAATSTDGTSWTKHPGYILNATGSGWEALHAVTPDIIVNNGRFIMFYAGVETGGASEQLGRADADFVPGAVRARLETGWGARAFDHAGMTEMGAYAYECSAQAGLHVNEAEFVAEVIDPATGVPAREGELVLTNLGRWCSPAVRYRTGDRVRLSEAPCACGRAFVRLEGGILGRLDDMLIVRGVNVFPAAIEGIVRRFAAVDEFQIEVSRDGELDEVCVLLEAGDEAVVRAVREALRAGLGIRLEARAVPPRSLPRFELKARRVVRR